MFSKKKEKVFARGNANFPRKIKCSPKKKFFVNILQGFWRFSGLGEKRSWPWPIFNDSKNLMPRSGHFLEV